MLALLAAAGLWAIQGAIQHRKNRQRRGNNLRTAAPHASAAAGAAAPVSATSSPCKARRCLGFQGWGRASSALRDNSLVFFQDRNGQVAVVQPCGNGQSWQLAFTCATQQHALPHDVGNLACVQPEAVFRVQQLPGSNEYAFVSLGAGGRYLSALRDLNAAPVLDSSRLTPPARWRVTHHGISSAAHAHKKLPLSVHELRAVHADALVELEAGIGALAARLQDRVAAGEAAGRALQGHLEQAARQAARAAAEHDARVAALGAQLGDAAAFSSQMAAALEQREAAAAALKEAAAQQKAKALAAERELTAAYGEVAALQGQLAERDDDVAQLQERMHSEARQWVSLRAGLQDQLAARDEEVAALSAQLGRLEAALRAVEHSLLYGMRRPRRMDRASLDAVSISQLQAAVSGGLDSLAGRAAGQPADAPSPAEAEALRVLLEDQAEGGEEGGPVGRLLQLEGFTDLDAEPGRELPLHDLEHGLDQSPRKGQQPEPSSSSSAAAAAQHPSSPVKGGGGGSSKAPRPPLGAGVALRVSSSIGGGARSSGASEGVHRYSVDGLYDDSSSDGEEPVPQQQKVDGGRPGSLVKAMAAHLERLAPS